MKRILLIEDNFEMRENISELLELSGYEISNAENGKKGVKLALTYIPDLIICDIMMPEMDGYEVLHLLSRNPKTSHIPFLFLSAKNEAKDMRKGMNLGADDYLTKPFEELDLLNAVEARFKRNEQLKGMESNTVIVHTLDALIDDGIQKFYEPKANIYSEHDHFKYIYYIVNGKVRMYKSHEAGKEFTIKLFGEGDWFGLSGAFEKMVYDHGAQAMEKTEVRLIEKDPFLEALFHSTLVKKVLTEVLEEKGENEKKLVELAYNSVRRRVADALIEQNEKYFYENVSGYIKIPRDALASIAGTSTESAIRMLSEFKDSGFISISKTGIKILELEKLKKAPY